MIDLQTYPTRKAAAAAATECRGWYRPRAARIKNPDYQDSSCEEYIYVLTMQVDAGHPQLYMRTDGYVR